MTKHLFKVILMNLPIAAVFQCRCATCCDEWMSGNITQISDVTYLKTSVHLNIRKKYQLQRKKIMKLNKIDNTIYGILEHNNVYISQYYLLHVVVLMGIQKCLTYKTLITQMTFIGPLSCVIAFVNHKCRPLAESFVANLTNVWTLPGMSSLV